MNLDTIIAQLNELSPTECSDLAGRLRNKWGVKADAPIAKPVIQTAPVVEEQTSFNVILKEAGLTKLNVIKDLRAAVTTLTLKEAKDLVDSLESGPKMIAEAIPKEEAQKICAKLEAAGAVVVME